MVDVEGKMSSTWLRVDTDCAGKGYPIRVESKGSDDNDDDGDDGDNLER